MTTRTMPKIVGFFLDNKIYYTSNALDVAVYRENELYQINETGWISFAVYSVMPKAAIVARFRIKWKGGKQ